ncbi:MAG TPA: SRPBCC family protein [Kofleriaceae bacterium]|nr:SRPBCC family protein [Kofleriaceae bacterium]
MQDTIRSRLVGVNVPPAERIATGLVGGLAIGYALRRRSLASLAGAGLGTIMVARALAGRCPVYRARAARKGIQVRKAVTVQATPREVYDLWRDLENLPRFMSHVKSITVEDNNISRWVVTQGGKELAWRSEIIEDTPGRRIRWKSLPGGDISHDGSIELREAPGDRGTVVEIKLHYFPPGGLLIASTLYGFLRKLTAVQLGAELARLQQILETGELTTGARRVEDLRLDDKAISATQVIGTQPAPVTSAGASTWDGSSATTTTPQTSSTTTGGAR